jgi:hypothetical protein
MSLHERAPESSELSQVCDVKLNGLLARCEGAVLHA